MSAGIVLDGIVPGQGDVEQRESKLPPEIPDAFIEVSSMEDVDDFPRGAVAHMTVWDEELAMDLLVAGAALIVIDRALLEAHDDLEAEDYAVLDEEGLWLPGFDRSFTRGDGVWLAPDEEE